MREALITNWRCRCQYAMILVSNSQTLWHRRRIKEGNLPSSHATLSSGESMRTELSPSLFVSERGESNHCLTCVQRSAWWTCGSGNSWYLSSCKKIEKSFQNSSWKCKQFSYKIACTKKVFAPRCFFGSFLKNSQKIIWLDIVYGYKGWTQDIVFGCFPSHDLHNSFIS